VEVFERASDRPDSIEGLYRRFRAPVTSYFRRRIPGEGEAEELTQEVFVRLTRHRESLSFHNIEGFVFTIAANLLRDRSRRNASRGGDSVSVEQDLVHCHDRNLVDVLEPERVAMGRQDLQRAVTALNELAERTQDVFVLQRIEGMKNKEIARELGISVSAVEKHMAKALTHIAERVARDD
jgi:RNA polymerase sigma-70 factor (ECF subfamily)